MSMTLAQLLALLPDNNTGAIDAADLRVIVTELHALGTAAQTTADSASSVANDAYGQIGAVTDAASEAASDAAEAQTDAAEAKGDAQTAQTAATQAVADAAAAQSAAASAVSGVSALTPRVTALEGKQELIGQIFSYEWSTAATPAVGKMTSNPQWNVAATKVLVSETTADGASIFFTLVDSTPGTQVRFTSASGAKITAHTTGPSVDMGTYREIPITINSLTGPVPASNERITMLVLLVIP